MSPIKSGFFQQNNLRRGCGYQLQQQLLLGGPPCSRCGPQHAHLSLLEAPLKQMLLGVVGSNSQECPVVFFGIDKQVDDKVCQDLLRQYVVALVQRT